MQKMRDLLAIFHGMLDCKRTPQALRDWGGPLNGQLARQKLVLSILSQVNFSAIVETGSFRGCSTEFFSVISRVPIHSIESNPRNFGFAKARLIGRSNCNLHLGSSHQLLPSLLAGVIDTSLPVFFYLDAHWNQYLPLRDEIKTISELCPHFIALIDDFEVPSEPEYSWDDYGVNGALNYAYIKDLIKRYSLIARYPSTPASMDTGSRRGSILLASPSMIDRVDQFPSIMSP